MIGKGQNLCCVRPPFGLQFNRVKTNGDDQISLGNQITLNQPANDTARAEQVIFGHGAFAF